MKYFFSFLILTYQKLFSGETGIITTNLFPRRYVCVFYPTCSEYTRLSIVRYGVLKGLAMGLKRIIKCRPGRPYGIDPVK